MYPFTTRSSSAIAGTVLAILLAAAGTVLAVEPQPFATCPGEAFVVQDVDATLFEGDAFDPVCPQLGIEVNNMGFRLQDRFVYAVELTAQGNAGMVRIGSDCLVDPMGSPAGLPTNLRFDAGELSSDGTTFYVHAGGTGSLYVVDLGSFAVTDVVPVGATGNVHDWAYHPAFDPEEAMLFGGTTGGKLAVLDVAAQSRVNLTVPGLPGGVAFGGARFNEAVNLVLYRNNGELYEIDVDALEVVDSGPARASTRNDATSCQDFTIGDSCNDAYFAQEAGAVLFRADNVTTLPLGAAEICGPADWQPPQAPGVEFNNLCFRKADRRLYGLELTQLPNGNLGLVRIDPLTCAVESLGVPADLPTDVRFDAGDCSENGDWLYVNIAGLSNRFYKIDLTDLPGPLTAVNVPIVKKHPQANYTGYVHDWAFRAADGLLYGGDSSDGQLAILDPGTGKREDRNLVENGFGDLPTGTAFGGAWINDAGRLVLHRNDGSLFEIDVVERKIVAVDGDEASTYNDGASCVGLLP